MNLTQFHLTKALPNQLTINSVSNALFSFSCVLWPLGVVVRITWFTVVRWSKILLIGFLAETSLFRRNHGRRYTMKMKRTLRRQTNACQGNARNYNYSPPKRNAEIAWWPDLTSKYTFLVRILRLSTISLSLRQ